MSGVIESLLKIKHRSKSKSYFIGLHRGKIWAEDHADYYERKEWGKLDHKEFDRLILPHNETDHFAKLNVETQLEWDEYLRGWIDGVREKTRH